MIITFNEPMVLLLGGYLQGVIPPGIADGKKAMSALYNIGMSHVAAREELFAVCGRLKMGISQNVLSFAPDRAWHPVDRAITHLAAHAYNHAFMEALVTGRLKLSMPGLCSIDQVIPNAKDSIDFVGINYYTRAHLRFTTQKPFLQFHYRDRFGRQLTDIGWEDYPEGFGQLLLEMKRYNLPIWITENGIDDRQGERRPQYLHNHWKQVLEAIDKGVPVEGYLYWSLLDNFEWLEGWGPRFGLYQVDFETLERRATPACHYFRQVATNRVLVAPPSAAPEPGRAPVPEAAPALVLAS